MFMEAVMKKAIVEVNGRQVLDLIADSEYEVVSRSYVGGEDVVQSGPWADEYSARRFANSCGNSYARKCAPYQWGSYSGRLAVGYAEVVEWGWPQ